MDVDKERFIQLQAVVVVLESKYLRSINKFAPGQWKIVVVISVDLRGTGGKVHCQPS